MPAWTSDQLAAIESEHELKISAARPDGTYLRHVPIWSVRVGDEVYVRTWHRRTTGWFGHAVASGRARIRVPGLESEVTVEDIGATDPTLRAAIDDAYSTKYGPDGATARMIADESAATTLRLLRSG